MCRVACMWSCVADARAVCENALQARDRCLDLGNELLSLMHAMCIN